MPRSIHRPTCRHSEGSDKTSGERAQIKVDAKAVKQLRQSSGAGMMDAKKALLQTGGDVDKAMEYLRKKGLASADKKSGRLASEGAVGAYIHAGSRYSPLHTPAHTFSKSELTTKPYSN